MYSSKNKKIFLVVAALFSCFLLTSLSAAEETFRINLKRGYNLISLPVNRTFTYAEIKKSTVPAYALGVVSTWDPLVSRNIATANLEFGKGYWVYANCPGTITLTSFPPVHSSLSLKKGWNLIGCPKAKEAPIEEALNPLKKDIDYQGLWIWDKTNYSASFTTLKPGEGYWLFMNKDFTLEINNEESFGELIGSEGGTIISPDKKAKLVIPQGALSAPTKIWLLNVDQNSLNGAQTDKGVLLSAVECRPQGLNFNKPVELIFTLKQAEVPGTKVTFAFYNPVSKVVTPTSLTSQVETDNYTLKFLLTKFFRPEDFSRDRRSVRGADTTSYYSSLKGPTSAPIGGGVKIPLPDMFTGAFSHSISLTIPPGRKGMQPSLALSYRSSNPNSWVGVGFSLNPGYIVRSTRLGPPSYNDTQDTFYFVTDAGTTELVHLIDNLYQAKIESSFAKFYKEPDDSWRILGKDGSVLKFGQSADSREISSRGTFSWYLTRTIDNNHNYITLTYIKDLGKVYLSRIDYTGNEGQGISPTHSIEFALTSREDITSSYISGANTITAKRLQAVEARVKSVLVWRYELEYVKSPDTGRSLLKSVTQFGNDNKSLPTQIFSYQQANSR